MRLTDPPPVALHPEGEPDGVTAGIGHHGRFTLVCLASALLALTLVAPDVASQVESIRERIPGILETLADAGYMLDEESLTVDVQSPEEARAHFDGKQDVLLAEGHFVGMGALLGALHGAPPIPPDALREVSMGAVTLAAYYDPDRSALVVVDAEWSRLASHQDILLAHELAHAVRDETHPLPEFFKAAHESVDRAHVRMTVIEGDAVLAHIAFGHQRLGRTLDGVTEDRLDLAEVRSSANDVQISIYEAGGRLALRHFRAGGLAAVDRLFELPPASTEQVLHAEKADDVPTTLPLPATDLDVVYETTLGELVIRGLLRALSGSVPDGTRAAIGWDGDTLRVLRAPDGSLAIQWRTLWDRELDAQQFAEIIGNNPKGTGILSRHERLVDWVAADDDELRAQLADSLAGARPELAPDADDALTAEAVEARHDATPYLHEGYWVHRGLGLRIPAPEECTTRFLEGVHKLTWPPDGRFLDNVIVLRFDLTLPAETLAMRFAAGIASKPSQRVIDSGTREVQGRAVADVTYTVEGRSGSEIIRVIGIPREDHTILISITVLEERVEQRSAAIEALIDGILLDE